MSTKTTYLKGGSGAVGWHDQGTSFATKFKIDTKKTPLLAADIEKLMSVPADTLIEGVLVDVKTAEGAAATVDVGDYLEATDAVVDADGFAAAVDANVVAASQGAGAHLAPLGTKNFRPAADHFIGVKASADLDAAVIHVTVYGRQLAHD